MLEHFRGMEVEKGKKYKRKSEKWEGYGLEVKNTIEKS